MGLPLEERQKLQVALLAEGVDRNPEEEQEETEVTSRPPRGGRG